MSHGQKFVLSLIGFHPMNELYETRGQNASRVINKSWSKLVLP
jgi:hypothetical protein